MLQSGVLEPHEPLEGVQHHCLQYWVLWRYAIGVAFAEAAGQPALADRWHKCMLEVVLGGLLAQQAA